MLETDDLSVMTDQQLAKWHAEAREAAAQYAILAENEWRMRPIRKQHELNKTVIVEQHKLNKRLVIITAIATLVAAILGGLIQRYAPDITWLPKTGINIETQSGKEVNTEVPKPPKELHGSTTTKETVSSKGPPREKHE
jgi:hypothetical protein